MGFTILYSSGDDGVAGFGGVCLDLDGTEAVGGPRFNPSFPGMLSIDVSILLLTPFKVDVPS